MTTRSLVYNKQKTYQFNTRSMMLSLFLLSLSFLCAVQGLYDLKFDPNIDEDNIPIAVPLNMSVVSVTPGASGQVHARIIYEDYPGEDQNITFVIDKWRRIDFKYGLVGPTKLVADEVPADCNTPKRMEFTLYTEAYFKGISSILLINAANFIHVAADVRPDIVSTASVFLLCDILDNQQYIPVQEWDDVPLNVNYPISIDGTVVAEGQICQLTTGINNDNVKDAFAYVRMTYGTSPFGEFIAQLTKQQGNNHARAMHLQNIHSSTVSANGAGSNV